MAGRFPYDPRDLTQRQQQQNQLTSHMRTTLGLAGNGLEDALFLHQQQRQHDIQRDLRLRQMILQEQLEQQNHLVPMLHEHQLRAIGEHLQDYPDLQQQYHTLLLREHLQHHEERAILEAQAQMRYQEELLLQQQLQVQQQQEPLTPHARAHAQALGETQVHVGAQGPNQVRDHSQIQALSVPSSVAMLRDLATDSLAGNAVKKTRTDRKRSNVDDRSHIRSPVSAYSDDEVEIASVKRPAKDWPKEKSKKAKSKSSPQSKSKKGSLGLIAPSVAAMGEPAVLSRMPLQEEEIHNLHPHHSPTIKPKPSLKKAPKSSLGSSRVASPHSSLDSSKLAGSVSSSPNPSLSSTTTPMQARIESPYQSPTKTFLQASLDVSVQASLQSKPNAALREGSPIGPCPKDPPTVSSNRYARSGCVHFQEGSPVTTPAAAIESAGNYVHDMPIRRLGTLEGILAAAETEDKEDCAVNFLRALKVVEWCESEDESTTPEDSHLEDQKGTCLELSNGYITALPLLPKEPLYIGPLFIGENGEKENYLLDDGAVSAANDGSEQGGSMKAEKSKTNARTVSNLLEYPYPVDIWWPSTAEIRAERKICGDESDEDAFEDEPTLAIEQHPLRANLPKIRKRLTKDLRPGVLEKIPHCKLHRLLMRRKKNLSVPDLVFCWQVTDIYPNDTMVCCSMCGTWRHAACGGHHESYVLRKNTKAAFVAVCDFCHEEEKILWEYPCAQKRLERQRMEHIRRGLATSAVMRHASFSKHGGTYKWPLGRVSATHISGHTRSVNTRHDKAEKQWADMVKRLGTHGSRPRERSRVRTKELERLLVSVEDAEAYTDRHNILLFLIRDTMRDHPVGFEMERRNIFDPEEDHLFDLTANMKDQITYSDRNERVNVESNGKELTDDLDTSSEEMRRLEKASLQCARAGCTRRSRFDSRFCSDSCGVSTLELDLLHSFYESSDIHPSVLRN